MVVTIRNKSAATIVLDSRDVERIGLINGKTNVSIPPTEDITMPDYEFRLLPDFTLVKWAGLITKGLIGIYFDAVLQTANDVAKYGVVYRSSP